VIAALLDHLWQSTLFAGAIALSMPLFRRQSASLRFWLWFTASMKFLIPFAALTTLGRQILSAMSPRLAEPVLTLIRPTAASFTAIAAPLAAPAPVHLPAADIAAVVWGAGLIALALLCLSRWLDLRATLKDADPVAIKAPVPVKSAPSFLEPGLVGIWRPVILLPIGLSQHLTRAELDAVLAHEICHQRRHDNLLAALHMLVEGLFWFHPLVWWIGRRLCEERERACDESVVAGGVPPLVYAEGILKTCRFYVQSPLACASGVSGADLKLRVNAILADQPVIALPPAKAMMLMLAGTLALLLPLAVGLLGSGPASKIARHIEMALAAHEMQVPVAGPAAPAPEIAIPHRKRHRAVSAASPSSSIQTEMTMMVRTPAIQIDTVLDSHSPAIPASVTATPQNEDILVCRKPQSLIRSRLLGPEVCLYARQWAGLHAKGLDISPDGKSVVGMDYEKQKTLMASSCPAPPTPGATTGWNIGPATCF
jgi:beta-lactamase regulating signal transducer with metallopeptidase domain